jgi:hypothetical protein
VHACGLRCCSWAKKNETSVHIHVSTGLLPLIAIIVILGGFTFSSLSEVQALPNWVVPALSAAGHPLVVFLNPTGYRKRHPGSRGSRSLWRILLAAANQITVVFLIGPVVERSCCASTDVLLTKPLWCGSARVDRGLLVCCTGNSIEAGPWPDATLSCGQQQTLIFDSQNDGPAVTGAWRPRCSWTMPTLR